MRRYIGIIFILQSLLSQDPKWAIFGILLCVSKTLDEIETKLK